MNFFAFTGVLTFVNSFAFAIFSLLKGDRRLHRIWAFFNFAVAGWGFGCYKFASAASPQDSLMWVRLAHFGVIAIPVFFFHFVTIFFEINRSRLVRNVYFVGGFFLLLNITDWIGFTKLFIIHVTWVFDSFYVDSPPGPLYIFFVIFFFWAVVYAHVLAFKKLKASVGTKALQIKYFIAATLIGFGGGGTAFAMVFGISLYPWPHVLIASYPLIMTYAIFRYRLMDIRIAVTSAGLLMAVYLVTLGIPFYLYTHGHSLESLVLMGILATGAPLAYSWLRRSAEEGFLAEQRRYQATLRQASAGMGRIRDLKKLLNLIVFVLTRVVRIERVLIYFVDRDNAVAHLNALRRSSSSGNIPKSLPLGHPLLVYFTGDFTPLAREELQQRMGSKRKPDLVALDTAMEELNAELVFPIFIRANLAAMVVLGRKLNNRFYSEDDLLVFSILANQASLAIENALSYENMKKTQEQLFKAEKMATIGTMADGLSHQINNRLHALGFIASDILDTVKLRRPLFNTPELKAVADEVEYSLSRIQDNVTRGGEIVQGLMKYTRKGDEGVAACRIDDIVMTAREMAQFKIRSVEFKLVKAYDPAVAPCVRGNFTQLQEVFFNLIDNAYDATVQRKAEKKEEGFVPTLRISVKEAGDDVEIIFSDNGTGVNPRDSEKLFTPFFTTKATSKKGTGLGLYIIRKIIEENHGGKVEVRSVYGQGTDMVLRLAISRS